MNSYERDVLDRVQRSMNQVGRSEDLKFFPDKEGKGDLVASFRDPHQVIDDVRNDKEKLQKVYNWVIEKALLALPKVAEQYPTLRERLQSRGLSAHRNVKVKIVRRYPSGNDFEHFLIAFDKA